MRWHYLPGIPSPLMRILMRLWVMCYVDAEPISESVKRFIAPRRRCSMNTQLTRRDFIKLVGMAGGGLVLAVYLDACAPATEKAATATPILPTSTPTPPLSWAPSIYLKLDSTGTLTVTAFRSEMGQGIRTAIAMILANELDMDWSKVRIEQAPADSRYGDQLTGGSVSISNHYVILRTAGASARQMLLSAAAQAWDVEPAQCGTEAGFVIHPDGIQKLAYGDLAEVASKVEPPSEIKLKEKSQWRIIGQGQGHWDAPQILTGRAVFGLDVRLPGMLFAVIAHCPVFEGTFDSYDDSAAKAVPGVKQILPLDDRITVVAENTWAAIQGRNALKVNWNGGKNTDLSSEGFRDAAIKFLTKDKPKENTLEALYEMPYEAHA